MAGERPSIGGNPKPNSDLPKEKVVIDKSIGDFSAETALSIADKLKMKLVEAHFTVTCNERFVDKHLFGDEEAHDATITIEGWLKNEGNTESIT